MGAVERRLTELCREAEQRVDPERGLRAIATLRTDVVNLEAEQVDRAIASGLSWRAVAEALGTSKQAVHKRHAARLAAKREAAASPYAPRIVIRGRARLAVRYAREEAALAKDDSVGTAHLLLGLLREGQNPAAHMLGQMGVSLDEARLNLQNTVVNAPPTIAGHAGAAAPPKRPPVSVLARAAFAEALQQAVERDEPFVDVEHLLLAILRDPEGGAARTLRSLGVDPDDVVARMQPEGRRTAVRA